MKPFTCPGCGADQHQISYRRVETYSSPVVGMSDDGKAFVVNDDAGDWKTTNDDREYFYCHNCKHRWDNLTFEMHDVSSGEALDNNIMTKEEVDMYYSHRQGGLTKLPWDKT